MLLKDNKALEAPQKKLLKELMSLEALADYCLVGGIMNYELGTSCKLAPAGNFYGVSDSYEPNEETKKAILQGNEEKKKGLLKKYKDLDRLFNDLAKGLDE